MSIATQIARLQAIKQNIAAAIAAKGVSTTGHGMSDFATDIAAIPSGGGTDDRISKLLYAGGDLDLSDQTDMTTIWSYLFANSPTGRKFTRIVLPSGITTINNYAFQSQLRLTECDLPATVETIGMYAFTGCTLWTIPALPSALTSLGQNAFYNCPALDIETIPSGVSSIPQSCFYNTGIQSLELPATVATVGTSAFSNCRALETLIIRATALQTYVFQNCYALKNVWISSECTTIAAATVNAAPFRNCTALTDVYCEASSKPSGWGDYWDCKSSTSFLTVHWGTSRADFEAIIAGE